MALDAEREVAEEGDLEVGRIDDLQAAITPVTSHGRWSGRHTLAFTNRGNADLSDGDGRIAGDALV